MRLDTDGSDDNVANLAHHHGAYGPGEKFPNLPYKKNFIPKFWHTSHVGRKYHFCSEDTCQKLSPNQAVDTQEEN